MLWFGKLFRQSIIAKVSEAKNVSSISLSASDAVYEVYDGKTSDNASFCFFEFKKAHFLLFVIPEKYPHDELLDSVSEIIGCRPLAACADKWGYAMFCWAEDCHRDKTIAYLKEQEMIGKVKNLKIA